MMHRSRCELIWAGVLLLMIVGVGSAWYQVGLWAALGVVFICLLWSATVGRLIK